MKWFWISSLLIFLVACEINGTENVEDHGTGHGEGKQPDHVEATTDHEGYIDSFENVTTENWTVEIIAENLNIPWNIRVSDDKFFIPEREGMIALIENGDLTRQEFITSDEIVHEGEGGLLGMVLTDDFQQTREAILYYTYRDQNGLLANKVVKARHHDDVWEETDVLLDEIPGDRIHNGGRIEIGPDDYLYVTTGDANDPNVAQEPRNLAGKILRMTLEGEIPEEQPFENSYVYSYGHRNPQGLAWNEAGELYSSEHGPVGHDEINVIEAGKNYGWPNIIGDEEAEGMENPLVHSGDDTWAPSGITFFEDELFVTGLRGESLYWLNEEERKLEVVFEGEGRLRDVISYQGSLFVITNNTDGRGTPRENDDKLLKLTLE
ncbi:sorbosone dehydrogenase family protein [Bacillus shivajii]|uniref:PQQ-dependent sugar dehydrogenase n=1 Tax=Bacillus shivajii TaxID=1983719 RepID=UPI001CFB2AF5|nr:sorbosone dehydrogenase family protein [Bacillus shivajii]UCZ52409.1 sorbosone dehydrogenase family protein [Bacillus shivajii]